MTNTLRELIANVELTKQDGCSHVEHRNARAALMGFMYDNAEAIADLIDAAQKVEQYIDAIVCYASTIDEHEPNRIAHDLRAALAKLTEGK